MIDSDNIVILNGGLTHDPEVSGELVKFSVAIYNAGNVKDEKNASGYFDVKVWTNSTKYTAEATAESVKKGLESGTLRKGARVRVVGRLSHERWKTDGKSFSRVVVIAESVNIMTFGDKAANTTGIGTAVSTEVAGTDASFVPDF